MRELIIIMLLAALCWLVTLRRMKSRFPTIQKALGRIKRASQRAFGKLELAS